MSPPEACDLGSGLNGDPSTCCTASCTFRGAGQVCRASAFGRCDVAETCTGSSATCPADQLLGGATLAAVDSDTGHCYVGFSTTADWLSAETACESLGGYLAVPESDSENNLARSVTNFSDNVWIGIDDIDVEAQKSGVNFVRVTGGNLDYNNFATNEPSNGSADEDCAQFRSGFSNWNDTDCGNSLKYICEIEPSSCGDHILQSSQSEQCDLGVQNGDTSSCCTSGCQFQPASTVCRGAGMCETVESACLGGSELCPTTLSFVGGANYASIDVRTGHCYLGFSSGLDWETAEAACESVDGYLASIDDGVENVTARDVVNIVDPAWIGIDDIRHEAKDDGSAFVKVAGGNVTFDAFDTGEPNNNLGSEDCAHFSAGERSWNDLDCVTPQSYVCELEPPLPPCSPTPLSTTACRSAEGFLQLQTKTADTTKNRVKWKWNKGQMISPAELGNPAANTDYRLCLYDGTGTLKVDRLISAGGMCGFKPCWKAIGSGTRAGFKFKNPNGGTNGITFLKVKAGELEKSSMLLKGKGSLFPMPTLPLSQSPNPVYVQLVNRSTTLCFNATLSSPATSEPGDTERFRDENDID